MPYQVIPRELAFFDLFEASAAVAVDAARELRALVEELEAPTPRIRRIRELERTGDDITHRIAALLNTTFVVPIDRSDIHDIASHLDDVTDEVETVGDLLVLYRIEEPLPQFRQQASVLVAATEAVTRVIGGLRTLTPRPRVMSEITRHERDGDHVFRTAVAALFSGDHKAMDVLKWKDILDHTERAIDRCEDVANAVESTTVKFA